jgi:hypothetical protein
MRPTASDMEELRALVMARWDPIGVHVPENGPDERVLYWNEYDSYLPTIVAHLDRGDGVERLTDYLAGLRTVNMGLPPHSDHDAAAAAAIVAWHTALRR